MKCHYLARGCSKNCGRGFETLLKLVYETLDDSRSNMAYQIFFHFYKAFINHLLNA